MKLEKGQISLWGAIVVVIIIISYLSYPDSYHNFLQYMVDHLSGNFGDSKKALQVKDK